LEAKFDDFDAGSFFCKLTYPVGHRRFAKNPNPAAKGRIWPKWIFTTGSVEPAFSWRNFLVCRYLYFIFDLLYLRADFSLDAASD
jgi:hypothetical protein